MHPRAGVASLTIACWVLWSVAIDAGRASSQTPSDVSPPAERRWQPMPLFPPGASVVFLVGDAFRGAGYMYVRFPAGYEPPLHSHKATERIFVSRGTLLLRLSNRDEIREPEGGYFVVKSGTVHQTACTGPEDCFCYISVDRAFDVIPFMKP
jgi:quercetin dioxygenase-like cupin family protein